MSAAEPADVSSLSFEAALAELDGLISRLEAGSIALDDAISAYERGTQLARHCEGLLDRTEHRVNALVVGAGGAAQEKPITLEGPLAAEPAAAQLPLAGERARPAARAVTPDDVPF